jgi:hypothetical protein
MNGDPNPRKSYAAADPLISQARQTPPQKSRKLIRSGWWICIAGLAVTLMGAHLIATGGKHPSHLALSTHNLGKLIMLIGFLTVLIGHRSSSIKKLFELPPPPQHSDPIESPFRKRRSDRDILEWLSSHQSTRKSRSERQRRRQDE